MDQRIEDRKWFHLRFRISKIEDKRLLLPSASKIEDEIGVFSFRGRRLNMAASLRKTCTASGAPLSSKNSSLSWENPEEGFVLSRSRRWIYVYSCFDTEDEGTPFRFSDATMDEPSHLDLRDRKMHHGTDSDFRPNIGSED